MEGDRPDQTTEKRVDELLDKRGRVGLSDGEANELGALFAREDGRRYTNASDGPHPDGVRMRVGRPLTDSLDLHGSLVARRLPVSHELVIPEMMKDEPPGVLRRVWRLLHQLATHAAAPALGDPAGGSETEAKLLRRYDESWLQHYEWGGLNSPTRRKRHRAP